MENKNIIIGGIVLVLLVVGAVWYFGSDDTAGPTTSPIAGEAEQVVNEQQNVEFTYYGGPEGYTLLESPAGANLGSAELVKAYTLVNTVAYNENNQSTQGVGQNIPAISVLIFNQPTSTPAAESASGTSTGAATEPTLAEWAAAHSGFTAYGIRNGEPEEVRIDNISAIHYTSDGPFPSETYVLKHRGKYYVFIGQYEADGDDIRKAFQQLMQEVYFL